MLPGSGGSSVLIGWVCSHLSSGHSIDLIHLSEAAIATPAATAADQPSVAEGAEAQDFEREVAKLTALSLADLSARLGAAATADTAPAVGWAWSSVGDLPPGRPPLKGYGDDPCQNLIRGYRPLA